MTDANYQQTEIKKRDMKVVMEYPGYSDEDNKIKDEVRVILHGALQEYMKKIL